MATLYPEPTVKLFHLGSILSITARSRLYTPGIAEEDGLLSFMTGEMLTGEDLWMVKVVCRHALLRQHPQLAAVDASAVTIFGWHEWLEEQITRYGEYLPVAPLTKEDAQHVTLADWEAWAAKVAAKYATVVNQTNAIQRGKQGDQQNATSPDEKLAHQYEEAMWLAYRDEADRVPLTATCECGFEADDYYVHQEDTDDSMVEAMIRLREKHGDEYPECPHEVDIA